MISADELSRLWRLHADGLLLLARMRCQSADDCVQVAFIRLATVATVPDDPPAWLARVVRNEAITVARSESRRRKREQRFAENLPKWFEPLHESSHDLLPDEMGAALQKLEPESREIVVAHVWGNLSFRQIAVAFDVSSSAAHRTYTQALQQLRTHLGVRLESE